MYGTHHMSQRSCHDVLPTILFSHRLLRDAHTGATHFILQGVQRKGLIPLISL